VKVDDDDDDDELILVILYGKDGIRTIRFQLYFSNPISCIWLLCGGIETKVRLAYHSRIQFIRPEQKGRYFRITYKYTKSK
jgi:hypothetical protein